MSTPTEEGAGKTRISIEGDRGMRIERIFAAPREHVWKAFTDPKLVAQWWGRGNRVEVERYEVERGGHWRLVEHGPEGISGFEGRFREISPPERLSETFEWDGMPGHVAVDDVSFEALDGGRTRVVTRTTFFEQEERDAMMKMDMEAGVNQSYAALDALLAKETNGESREARR